jgi:hypothetical protein
MKYTIVVTPVQSSQTAKGQLAFCEDFANAIKQIFGQNVAKVEVIEGGQQPT